MLINLISCVIYLNSAFTNRIKHFYTLVILWKAYTQYVFVLSTLRYLAYDFRQQGLLYGSRHTTHTTAVTQRVLRSSYARTTSVVHSTIQCKAIAIPLQTHHKKRLKQSPTNPKDKSRKPETM